MKNKEGDEKAGWKISIGLANFLRYERASHPRFEPHFSRAYAAAGGRLPDGWKDLARAVDLTALLEILTRPGQPGNVIRELRDLLTASCRRDHGMVPSVQP